MRAARPGPDTPLPQLGQYVRGFGSNFVMVTGL